MGISTHEYRIEVQAQAAQLDAGEWNALLARQARPTPFMRHEYLMALQDSGSAVESTGWAPRWVTLVEQGRLRAACPLYLKAHSYGEYVFDWSWADAYRRHGLAYYPKALCAVPFTPVAGTRLLADDELWRGRLVEALTSLVRQAGLSSAHVLFVGDDERQAFERAGWLLRHGVQFHWCQDLLAPMEDFDALLARMQRDKRKKILQERRRVAQAGVRFSVHEGAAIDGPAWDFFYHCYTLTYRAHHSTPYLTRDFFARMAASLAESWVMFVARQGDEPVACSLIAVDRGARAAWGRWWGATRYLPCLHFEACYYQPLQWCLEQGFERFEGGAQGEHKMARGLLPVTTHSAHWIADDRFRDAIAEALGHERSGIVDYVDELSERTPFRSDVR